MVLQKLTLENFQGIRSLELDFPDGCSGNIYGDNATGKTTIFNALTWLLFDKASTGVKNFTPQTRDADGEIHHLNHIAEGEFIADDGRVVTLKKDFHENWKKKRGAAEAELAGHVTDYYINSVPVKEAEYNETVLGYCGGDAEKLKILTMPDYFPEKMKWQDRRQLLLAVCGDVTDDDVIASNEALKELPEFLKMPGDTDQKYSIDEYRKITAAKRKELNQKLDSIPERIDEATKAMPDLTGLDQKVLWKEMDDLEKEIERLTEEKADAKAGDASAAKILEEIAEKKAGIAEAKTAYVNEWNHKNEAATSDTKKHADRRWELVQKSYEIENRIQSLQSEKAKMEADRNALLKEWQDCQKITWHTTSELCPACGQRLPEGKIEEKRQEFNLRKSKSKESIRERGEKCSKDKIAEKQSEIEKAELELQTINSSIEEENDAINRLKETTPPLLPFEETDQYKKMMAEVESLKSDEANTSDAVVAAVAAYEDEIKAKRKEYSEVQTKAAGFDIAATQKGRIEALETEQRKLAEEFDRTEKGLHLADLFTKTKVSLLTDRINSRFKTVSFQLFTDQVNGGVKEGCEVLVPGEGGRMIPYAYANNAARINAGLEIIGTLADYWKIKLPVIVDNCEAVTHPLRIDTQVIRLYVSAEDQTLRLVTDKKED